MLGLDGLVRARSQRGLRRLRLASALSVVSGASLLAMSAVPAINAFATGSAGLFALFELDGNTAQNATTPPPYDWEGIFNPDGSQKAGIQNLFSSTFVGDGLFSGTPSDTTVFTSGSHDVNDISTWSCGHPSSGDAKNDMSYAYGAAFLAPQGNTRAGHELVYLGQQRVSNNGDSFSGFWLLQGSAACTVGVNGSSFSGSHVNGDLLVVSDYTNGGSVNAVSVFEWMNGALNTTPVAQGPMCSAATDPDLCSQGNGTTAFTTPWTFSAANSVAANEFVESGVDLDALFTNGAPCFAHFVAETRSSQSADAELHDFALGTLSSCPPTHTATTSNPTGGNVALGTSVTDTATVTSDTGTPTGTVAFFLCQPGEVSVNQGCVSGGTQVGSAVALTNGSATSAATTHTDVVGTYCWRAEYTPAQGTRFQASSHTNFGTECFTVVPNHPALATSNVLVSGDGTLNTDNTIRDLATLTGAFGAAGSGDTATFTLWKTPIGTAPTCTASGASTAVFTSGPIAFGGGTANTQNQTWTATSGTYAVTGAGNYEWTATFSGDPQNVATTEGCGVQAELISLPLNQPTLTTSNTPTSGVVGSSGYTDSATLTGGYKVGGETITFSLYGPLTSPSPTFCDSPPASVFHATSALTQATLHGTATTGTVTDNVALVTPGTYYWVAVYAGDANNQATHSGCLSEPVSIVKASPVVTTTQTPSSGTAGLAPQAGTYNDSASVAGGFDLNGQTVTFKLYGPYASAQVSTTFCVDATALFTGTAALSGPDPNGPDTASVTGPSVLGAGHYYWVASYGGDPNNNPARSGCLDEPVTVVQTQPVIATSQSPTSSVPAPLSGGFSDSATVTGGYLLAGQTITFRLYGPLSSPASDFCTSGPPAPVFTKATTLSSGNPNGPYTASVNDPNPLPGPGTYYWVASYAGDVNNLPSNSPCTSEPVVVSKVQPTIATTSQDTSATLLKPNQPVGDTATISNAYNPTGSVTFTLVDSSCTPVSPAVTQTVTISSHTATGATVSTTGLTWTPQANGNYFWTATYSGDANNNPISSPVGCNDSAEIVVVSSSQSHLSKAQLDVTAGDVSFTASEITYALSGDVIRYQLTYSNAGTGEADNVTVTDAIPAGTSYVASSCAGANGFSCSVSSGTVTFTKAAVAGSTTVVVGTFEVTVVATGAFDILNLGHVTTLTEALPIPSNTVEAVGPLSSLSKAQRDVTAGQASFTQAQITNALTGDDIRYQLTYTNSGLGAATGVVITDAVPAGTSFLSCLPLGCSQLAGLVTFNLGTVSAGQTVVVTFDVSITAHAPFTITNVAGFTTSRQSGTSNTVTAVGPLSSLTKAQRDVTADAGSSFSPAQITNALTGDDIQYQLTYTNSGSGPSTGVVLTDAVPAGTSYVTCSTPQGTCSQSAGTVTFTVGTVNAGASVAVTFDVTITATGAFTIDNVSGFTTSRETGGSNHVTAVGPLSSLAKAQRDVTANASASFSQAPITNALTGDHIQYQLTYANGGNGPSTNVVLTDAVPAGTSYVTCSTPQGTCSQAAGTVTFTLGTVNAHTSVAVTFDVTITAHAPFTVDNVAGFTTSREHGGSNHVTATGPLSALTKAQADLGPSGTGAATFSATPITTALTGDVVEYQLTYTNTGSAPATGVTVTDAVPAGSAYVASSCTTSQGTCAQAAGTVTFTLGDVSPSSVVMTFKVTITATAPFTIDNVAGFTAGRESGSSNHVTATGPLTAITKAQRDVTAAGTFTANPITAALGDTLEYQLTVTNTGSAPATGVTVTDTVPTHTTFNGTCSNSCTSSGTAAGSTITWAVGTIAAGGSVNLTFQVTIDTNLPVGTTQITNAAVVTTPLEGSKPSNTVVASVTLAAQVQALAVTVPNTGADLNLRLGLTLMGLGILALLASLRRRERGSAS